MLARILASAGYDPKTFASGDEFLRSRGPGSFDAVVTDLRMEGASGLDVLEACRSESDSPAVLLVTGFASIRTAVEAMRLGAFDYLTKPVDPKELLHRLDQALEGRRLKRAVNALSGEVRRHHGLASPIGDSAVMRGFLARASEAASSSAILIFGETGTGKDVIARQIQATGPRAGKTFLTLNCASLSETLLESELFGPARDAYSKGNASRRGLFEEASGGTLFLNAVGSLTPRVQASLLRVLEEGAVRRVGEDEPIPVDVRIIAATNRDLKKAIGKGEFRRDLYNRLSVVTLIVPRLRERPEDIEPLARHFLEESVRRLGKLRVFAPETLDFLRGYPFPGNVRELRHAIEQAVIVSEDGTLHPTDFVFFRASQRVSAAKPGVAGRLRPLAREIPVERLEEALRDHGGNHVRAARALGISRATFYRLLGRTAPQTREEGSG